MSQPCSTGCEEGMKKTVGEVAFVASACLLTMWLPLLGIAIGLGLLGGFGAAIGLPVAGVLVAGGVLTAVVVYRWWRRLGELSR